MKLIDSYVPDSDAAEFHSIVIRASPQAVWKTLHSIDFGEIFIAKLLLGLRALPALIFDPGAGRKGRRRFTLADLQAAGFGKLAERPGAEIVLGVTGRFWSPVHNVDPFEAQAFKSTVQPGRARAVWDFVIESGEGDGTLLSTETRVVCGDPLSRVKFRAYWTLVRPFSGLIRILMLRAIRSRCES